MNPSCGPTARAAVARLVPGVLLRSGLILWTEGVMISSQMPIETVRIISMKKYALAFASVLSWAVSIGSTALLIGIIGKLLILLFLEGPAGVRVWIENISKSELPWASVTLLAGLAFLGLLSWSGVILARQ